MENKINIAEILKDCPKGMKLYSPLFGEVKLYQSKVDIISVFSKDDDGEDVFDTFTENGLFYSGYSQAESLLSPSSEMRDWTKFFKRGDIVIKDGGGMAAVFDGWANDTYTEFNTTVNLYCDNNTGEEEVCTTLLFRKATEEERNQFIEKVERILKGKYNPDTLQVEPIKPECPFKPFDKVLVRDAEGLEWYANYFSYYREYDQGYPYACMGVYYRYCIPYEGNEHLLGTTDPYTEGGSK
jgi:hypothetical protein